MRVHYGSSFPRKAGVTDNEEAASRYLTTRIFGGPFFRPNGGCPRQ